MNGTNACLLDTSIVIDTFKDQKTAERLDTFNFVFISATAIGELYYGAYRSANPQKHLTQIELFLQNCTILSVDKITAEIYGKIKSQLKAIGKPIPENDIWIAAISFQYNLPLFTTDNHFKEIEDIILI